MLENGSKLKINQKKTYWIQYDKRFVDRMKGHHEISSERRFCIETRLS